MGSRRPFTVQVWDTPNSYVTFLDYSDLSRTFGKACRPHIKIVVRRRTSQQETSS